MPRINNAVIIDQYLDEYEGVMRELIEAENIDPSRLFYKDQLRRRQAELNIIRKNMKRLLS
jgi:hypothetical protein